MTGRLLDLSVGLNRKQRLTLEIDSDFRESFNQLQGVELVIDIKQCRKRRSLNANNYCWALLEKLAEVLRTDKEAVYVDMLRRYGAGESYLDDNGNECKAVFSLRADIPPWLVCRYYQEIGRSELNGQVFIHYRALKGSSEYDSKEMSVFLDGIVSECQEVGIPTDTPEQLARYKDLWGEKYAKQDRVNRQAD